MKEFGQAQTARMEQERKTSGKVQVDLVEDEVDRCNT